MNQTIEQQRSSYAFNMIKQIKDKGDKNIEKKSSTIILKLGTLILTNGLGNTLAFLYSKSKDEHLITLYILFVWLLREDKSYKFDKNKLDYQQLNKNHETFKEVFDKMVNNATVEQYMYYTEEALRLANWLKRYAEAMLEKEE